MNRPRSSGRRYPSIAMSLLSAVVGLAPGLVLPFVVSARMSSDLADQFLLAYSVALILTNIAANTIEQNTIAEYGRFDGRHKTPSYRSWRSYTRSTRAFATAVVVLGFPSLVAIYGIASGELAELVLAALPLVAVPIIGALSAERSAQIIVHGQVSATILLQSCRAVVPLGVILAVPSAPLWMVTSAITLGELLRLLGLAVLLRGVRRPFDKEKRRGPRLASGGLWWQASSMVTSQAGSVTDRAFLGAAPSGSVAAYEMSDKILYAGVQVLVSGLLLRSVAGWARAAESSAMDFLQLLRRQLAGIVGIAVVAALLAVGALELFISSRYVDPAWIVGLRWGQLAVLSMPLSVLMTALGRVLVVLRRQRYLVPLVILGLVSNLVLNLVLFGPFSGFGILLSSVASRVIGSAAYVFVVIHILRNWNATDNAGKADAG